MKAKIYTTDMFGYFRPVESDMNASELYRKRREIQKSLVKTFSWKDYDARWNHLVYYVEFDDTAYIYPNGHLYTEEEFTDLIQTREGVGYVGAWHRKD